MTKILFDCSKGRVTLTDSRYLTSIVATAITIKSEKVRDLDMYSVRELSEIDRGSVDTRKQNDANPFG